MSHSVKYGIMKNTCVLEKSQKKRRDIRHVQDVQNYIDFN